MIAQTLQYEPPDKGNLLQNDILLSHQRNSAIILLVTTTNTQVTKNYIYLCVCMALVP